MTVQLKGKRDCKTVLKERLDYLDNQYSKQPTLRLKTKIGEVWRLLQEVEDNG